MLVLRDGRPERQAEGGLRVALTLCVLDHPPNESPQPVMCMLCAIAGGAAHGATLGSRKVPAA